MSNRSGQRWVFLRHQETGGTHWVPDNPGVVPDFEGSGWHVAEPGNGERPPGTYRSDRDRLAEPDSQLALLEVTCDGGKRHPHDVEVLLVAGRDLRPGGSDLFLRASQRDPAGWDTRDGDDGFRYYPDYPAQASRKCSRCRATPVITAEKLRKALDAMLRHSKGEPVVLRVDFRRIC